MGMNGRFAVWICIILSVNSYACMSHYRLGRWKGLCMPFLYLKHNADIIIFISMAISERSLVRLSCP